MPKKNDLLLILALLLLSLLPLALRPTERPEGLWAEITVDGVLDRRVPLAGDGPEEIIVETPEGRNVIRAEKGGIAFVDADCPDKLCVRAGSIHHPGETAACLPHRVLIEIKGEKAGGSILPAK